MEREPPTRNLYWVLPNMLVLGLAVAVLGGGIALVLLGHAALGAAVLGLAVLALLVLAQEAARRDRRSGRVRAFSGYAGASLRMWSRASGRVARLRLESSRLLRQRDRVQFELGAAVYASDRRACSELIARMRALDGQLAECAAETAHAIEEVQSRIAAERLAIASTEIRRAR